jgi:phosphatidylinositol alpha-1,6-mannosyltransferase
VRPTLLIAYDFPPARGGIARVMGEVARRHPAGSLVVSAGGARGSAAVDATFPNRIDRMPVSPARLRVVPGILLWSRRVAALARAVDAGFVWSGHLKPATYAARWTHERLGVPYGVIVYGGDLLALQHQMHRMPLQRRSAAALLGSASVIVAVSEWTRDLLLVTLSELGLSPDSIPVRVVPLGTDPAEFHPRIDATEVRRRFGLDDGRWMLTIGASGPHKGVDTALRALAALRDRRPELRYAIAGPGRHIEALGRLADAHGVGDRVRFIRELSDADLPALYNAADIYLGVSRREGRSVEGFGLALAEASACGVPVIAGRSGGIPELIADGETGLLVDPERTEPLVQAIERLLDEPALAARLGAGGRAAVERQFNWDRTTADLRAIAAEFGRRDR